MSGQAAYGWMSRVCRRSASGFAAAECVLFFQVANGAIGGILRFQSVYHGVPGDCRTGRNHAGERVGPNPTINGAIELRANRSTLADDTDPCIVRRSTCSLEAGKALRFSGQARSECERRDSQRPKHFIAASRHRSARESRQLPVLADRSLDSRETL